MFLIHSATIEAINAMYLAKRRTTGAGATPPKLVVALHLQIGPGLTSDYASLH